MAYRIDTGLSPRPSVEEAADFVEIQAWLDGRFSAMDLENHMSRNSEHHETRGVEDEDDRLQDFSFRVLNELDRRVRLAGKSYPFHLKLKNSVLEKTLSEETTHAPLYLYLLLVNRLNMNKQRHHNGKDGTVIFEHLCAYALRTYLGGKTARSLVFGTAVSGSFSDKINHLCGELREGIKFESRDNKTPSANDNGLDVVGWLPFADRRASQLTIFGQCKTGTSWQGEVERLRPIDFTEKWMRKTYACPPLKAFFIAEVAESDRWGETSKDAHLLFERFRILECMWDIETECYILFEEIQSWICGGLEEVRRSWKED